MNDFTEDHGWDLSGFSDFDPDSNFFDDLFPSIDAYRQSYY